MCRLVTNLVKLQIQLPHYSCIVYYIDNNTTNRIHPSKRINVTSMYHRFEINISPTTFSGFLIVAACVMTFEARDSATKIVPTAPQGPQKEQVNFL